MWMSFNARSLKPASVMRCKIAPVFPARTASGLMIPKVRFPVCSAMYVYIQTFRSLIRLTFLRRLAFAHFADDVNQSVKALIRMRLLLRHFPHLVRQLGT